MKVAVYQTNPILLDVQTNLEEVIDKINHGREPDEIIGIIERDVLRKKKIMLPYSRNDDPYFTHRELTRILFRKY